MRPALPPRVQKRLHVELTSAASNPLPGISFEAEEGDGLSAFHSNVRLLDGPHAGAVLHMVIVPPAEYPNKPPAAYFRTSISGVYTGGAASDGPEGTSICLDLLSNFSQYHTEWGKDGAASGWAPSMKIETLLVVIQGLMKDMLSSDPAAVERLRKASSGCTCSCGHRGDAPGNYKPALAAAPAAAESGGGGGGGGGGAEAAPPAAEAAPPAAEAAPPAAEAAAPAAEAVVPAADSAPAGAPATAPPSEPLAVGSLLAALPAASPPLDHLVCYVTLQAARADAPAQYFGVGVGFPPESRRKPVTPAEPFTLEAFLDGTRASSRNTLFTSFLPLCVSEARWAAGGEAAWAELFKATEGIAREMVAPRAAPGGGGGAAAVPGAFFGGAAPPCPRVMRLAPWAAAAPPAGVTAAAGPAAGEAPAPLPAPPAPLPAPPASVHTRAVDALCALLNSTVVAASDATCTSASEQFACGYLALARSLRALLAAFPVTAGAYGAAKLRHFAASRDNRAKAHHPDLGELLPLLAAVPGAGELWTAGGLGEAVWEQSAVRNVRWFLGELRTTGGELLALPPARRAASTFAATLKSRRIVAFQVRFATLAGSIRFSDFADFAPPPAVLAALRDAHKAVQAAAAWGDHRALLGLPPISEQAADEFLCFAVGESERLGYHQASGGGGGGGGGGGRGGRGGGGRGRGRGR